MPCFEVEGFFDHVPDVGRGWEVAVVERAACSEFSLHVQFGRGETHDWGIAAPRAKGMVRRRAAKWLVLMYMVETKDVLVVPGHMK